MARIETVPRERAGWLANAFVEGWALYTERLADELGLYPDELARFGVNERHLQDRICDPAWQALMRFQVERTREIMLSGRDLGKTLPGRVGLEIRTTVQGGLRILEKIERAGFDVFRRRPTLKAFDWPLLLLKAV